MEHRRMTAAIPAMSDPTALFSCQWGLSNQGYTGVRDADIRAVELVDTVQVANACPWYRRVCCRCCRR